MDVLRALGISLGMKKPHVMIFISFWVGRITCVFFILFLTLFLECV